MTTDAPEALDDPEADRHLWPEFVRFLPGSKKGLECRGYAAPLKGADDLDAPDLAPGAALRVSGIVRLKGTAPEAGER